MNATEPTSPSGPLGTFEATRRDLLKVLAFGSAGLVVGAPVASCSNRTSGALYPRRGRGADERLLVVVELGGGNDGLSTLVPFADGSYHDLRPTLALGPEDVIDWGRGLGLNARLRDLAGDGLAVLSGVGSINPDLSHFEMLDRWWRGSAGGPTAADQAGVPTGFLGRLCDALSGDERFTGVTLNFGNAPALRSNRAATTGLPAIEGGFLSDDSGASDALRRVLAGFATSSDGPSFAQSRQGVERMMWILELLRGLPAASAGYPDTDIGMKLAIASRIARSDTGVRVIHVPMAGSDFDTHAKHASTHPRLLDQLNGAVHAFMKDMSAHGLEANTLVATTSEFGRRPEEHDGGLDHGTASCMMLLGPVVPGLHGEPSSLTRFDENDNLIASLPFDRYYATLSGWMGVDVSRVLPSDASGAVPQPLAGLLRS